MATDVAVTLPALRVLAETGLTVSRLRGFVASTLSDGDLQMLLDAALEAIDGAIGPPGEVTETHLVHGDLMGLSFRSSGITSIVEDVRSGSPVTLAADDYELSDSGTMLTRLRTGTNPAWCWRGRVKVTHVPADDAARRNQAAIELVRLGIAFNPGLASQTIGTWSESYAAPGSKSYPEQRADILASLTDSGLVR